MDFNFVSFISRNLKPKHDVMLRQELFSAYNASISLEQQRMVIYVHNHIAVVAIYEEDKEE